VLDLLGEMPPLEWIVMRDDAAAEVSDDVELVRQALCAELDPERAAEVHRKFVLQSVSSLASPSTAPNRGHPTTYIICEKDQAIPPSAQEAISAQADHVVRVPTSHNPQFSIPEEVAGILASVL
jgi:pimeloyl-ACP methyl ester carboxylesterase